MWNKNRFNWIPAPRSYAPGRHWPSLRKKTITKSLLICGDDILSIFYVNLQIISRGQLKIKIYLFVVKRNQIKRAFLPPCDIDLSSNNQTKPLTILPINCLLFLTLIKNIFCKIRKYVDFLQRGWQTTNNGINDSLKWLLSLTWLDLFTRARPVE